jgi:hypothetical protein
MQHANQPDCSGMKRWHTPAEPDRSNSYRLQSKSKYDESAFWISAEDEDARYDCNVYVDVWPGMKKRMCFRDYEVTRKWSEGRLRSPQTRIAYWCERKAGLRKMHVFHAAVTCIARTISSDQDCGNDTNTRCGHCTGADMHFLIFPSTTGCVQA